MVNALAFEAPRVAGGLGGENRLRRQSAIRPRRRRVDCNCHRIAHRNRHRRLRSASYDTGGHNGQRDRFGGRYQASPIVSVSATQVTYQIPPGTASGPATVTITAGDGVNGTAAVQVAAVAPGYIR